MNPAVYTVAVADLVLRGALGGAGQKMQQKQSIQIP